MKLGRNSTEVPIQLCELHPLTAGMRIDIEKNIDELADDIRRHEQMQPGRVLVARDGRYQAYMGSRRFLACKLLFDDKGKLKTYKAFIDDDLTDEEIIERALAENATEKKGRLDIRLLEELHYFALLSRNHTSQEIQELALAGGMKKDSITKKLTLLDFLTAEDAERLYWVEEETGFRFEVDLLLGIWQFCNGDKATFLGACSYAAKDGDWTVKGLNEDLVQGGAPEAVKIPWFAKIFPNFVPREILEQETDDVELPANQFVQDLMNTSNAYSYIPCKKCKFEIPIAYSLKMNGIPFVVAFKFKEDGTTPGERATLGVTFDGRIVCRNCNSTWKILLRPEDKEKARISLKEAPQEEEEAPPPTGDVIEQAMTKYSPAFNQFIFIDHGKWYFYDTPLGRRRPMTDEEIEKHKSYFRNLLNPKQGADENSAVDDTIDEAPPTEKSSMK